MNEKLSLSHLDSQIPPPPPRKDGKEKLLGRAQYVDDLRFPGMIHGVTIRSTIARGQIKNIHFKENLPWDQFIQVTAKDIPGKNCIAHLIEDQPCLADRQVNHPEEAILLLAHPDKHLLEEARKNVVIEYQEHPPILTLEDSLAKKEIIWGNDNCFKKFTIEKGNVDSVWSTADYIIEGEYFTGAQEQLYIEPQGMIAVANPKEGVTVWGSMQCPYYVHHALQTLFQFPAEKIRVIQCETGGGFGGKEDYPSMIAGHAALLSWKSGGKPVKIIYDRTEDMAATTKRHPSRTRHKTAVSKDGKLLAMDIDFILDGGAYSTLSAVVLSRGGIHAAGPYACPHVRIRAHAVATNTPPHGAFRGFGAPQSLFAVERHMDRIAHDLQISPLELRKNNFLKKGDTTATSQTIREDVDLLGLVQTALKAADYDKKAAIFQAQNQKPHTPLKRGIGFSVFMHGAGFTGAGEKNLSSVAAVEATAEGRIRCLASSTEIGQGSRTVFAQIVSKALSIDYARVDVIPPDTDIVPNSGPTVASRTTMIVGKLLENAAVSLKQILIQSHFLKPNYTEEEFIHACQKYIQNVGPLKSSSQYQQPEHIQWDDKKYQGDAYGTFAWACYVAEVSVNTLTYETQVEHFVAAQEIGKVMHPLLAEGQIEGGVVQGIGFSLYEQVQWKQGRMANPRMTNYIIPTSMDTPPIKVLFWENPYPFGPQGAKGIGELPLDGVAPAILNAIEFATQVPVNQVPLLPEIFFEFYKKNHSLPRSPRSL